MPPLIKILYSEELGRFYGDAMRNTKQCHSCGKMLPCGMPLKLPILKYVASLPLLGKCGLPVLGAMKYILTSHQATKAGRCDRSAARRIRCEKENTCPRDSGRKAVLGDIRTKLSIRCAYSKFLSAKKSFHKRSRQAVETRRGGKSGSARENRIFRRSDPHKSPEGRVLKWVVKEN